MKLLTKIYTAIKGLFREAGELSVKDQGIRIVKQKIEDAKSNQGKTKGALVKLMADHRGYQDQITKLTGIKEERESQIKEALRRSTVEGLSEQRRNELINTATAIEKDIQTKVTQIDDLSKVCGKYELNVATVKTRLGLIESHINEGERNLALLEANQTMQDAMGAIGLSDVGATQDDSMLDALKEIEEDQADWERRFDVANELNQSNLDTQIEQSGLSGGDTEITEDTLMAKYLSN